LKLAANRKRERSRKRSRKREEREKRERFDEEGRENDDVSNGDIRTDRSRYARPRKGRKKDTSA
jgi:hypothetical protein